MILVVGATGALGGEICHRLATSGKRIRALVRPTTDEARLDRLRTLGAELVEGDLKDRASLDRACGGATAVITTATTTMSRQPGDTIDSVDQEGQLQLIDAAREAGVSRFVFVSYSGNIDVDCPLTTAKRTVERHLTQSGMTYTILRPSYFMEVWLSPVLGFDAENAKVQVFGNGQSKISFVSFKDVARIAVDSLDNPAALNATIEIGGPEALTPLEVIAAFEKARGRKFVVEPVPEEALEAQLATATDPLQKSFTALMLNYAHGDAIDSKQTLANFPARLTSIEEYARGSMDR